MNGMGALALIWMVLDSWPATVVPIIGGLTVLIPFILEIVAICHNVEKFRIIDTIQNELRK